MVVFTCNHCGDSLQKPRVEKHYQTTCRRNFKSMTCVDCLKDFNLEEYVAHTKCITETERYAAKGTVVGVPKGEKKQESWVETVQNVIEEHKHNVSPNIKNIFDIIVKHSNIPKKKKPFINFLMNSAGRMIKANDIEEVWNIMEKYKTDHNIQSTNLEKNKENDSKKSNKEENKVDTAKETAQTNGEDKKEKKKSKKNKNNETDGETENQTTNGNEENNIEESNKSKKKRKSKHESVVAEDVPEKKQKLEEGETPQENGETKSKKKKRKSEKMEENKTESKESKTELEEFKTKEADTSEENGEKKSKKKKRKSEKMEENNMESEENKTELEESKTELEEFKTKEAETSEENGEKKSKKKKRKSEKIEENNTESEANKTELHESKTEINNDENISKDTDKSSKKKKRRLQTQEAQENNGTNGIIENDEQKIEETSSKKKRKKSLQNHEECETKQNELNGNAENDENQTEEQSPKKKRRMDDFNWIAAIQEILTNKSDGIHKDKLQSKVFEKFEKEIGTIDNEKEKKKLIKQFNNKLQSFAIINIENDFVEFSNYSWVYAIKNILINEPDGIQKEELEARVFEDYEKINGAIIDNKKKSILAKYYKKKLKSIRNKTINNDIITLVT